MFIKSVVRENHKIYLTLILHGWLLFDFHFFRFFLKIVNEEFDD